MHDGRQGTAQVMQMQSISSNHLCHAEKQPASFGYCDAERCSADVKPSPVKEGRACLSLPAANV